MDSTNIVRQIVVANPDACTGDRGECSTMNEVIKQNLLRPHFTIIKYSNTLETLDNLRYKDVLLVKIPTYGESSYHFLTATVNNNNTVTIFQRFGSTPAWIKEMHLDRFKEILILYNNPRAVLDLHHFSNAQRNLIGDAYSFKAINEQIINRLVVQHVSQNRKIDEEELEQIEEEVSEETPKRFINLLTVRENFSIELLRPNIHGGKRKKRKTLRKRKNIRKTHKQRK